jgi:hypothetical protein
MASREDRKACRAEKEKKQDCGSSTNRTQEEPRKHCDEILQDEGNGTARQGQSHEGTGSAESGEKRRKSQTACSESRGRGQAIPHVASSNVIGFAADSLEYPINPL